MTSKSLHVLQLSDLHLYADKGGELKNVNTYDAFMAILSKSFDDQSPRLLLLSGDLAERGEQGAYLHIKAACKDVGVPTFFIPGNHDENDIMHATLKGEGVYPLENLLVDAWQLIGLNSCVAGQIYGFLSDRALAKLKQQLDQSTNYHVAIILHHHVFPVGTRMDEIGLRHADKLIAMLENYPNVKVVLSGHAHKAFAQEKKGIQWMVAPSTCYQVENDIQAPGARMLKLHADGKIDTQLLYLE